MKNANIISVQKVCVLYEIPSSFVESLLDFELINAIHHDNELYIHHDQIGDIEKLIRLHYDLNINFEGLDVIHHLLNNISSLEDELIALRNTVNI